MARVANPHYVALQDKLRQAPRTWLVTGAAGFIGSHLVETLLGLDQTVIGLDNYATGSRSNLDEVGAIVGDQRWRRFRMIEGDIRDLATCRGAVEGVEIVLHQAALGSVSRSIVDPIASHDVNVTGFLNMLIAARDAGIERFVYASSSSVYGDEPNLPKVEDRIGRQMSPYAATKYMNEVYAGVFDKVYGFKSIGLRYFNVFGPRQDPNGPYAAVIPKWIAAMRGGDDIAIYGDGETSRDFCFVANAVQANLLAAVAEDEARGQVFNVAVNARTSLDDLFDALKSALAGVGFHYNRAPVYAEFRPGDVRHSQADTAKAEGILGYRPEYSFADGLRVMFELSSAEIEAAHRMSAGSNLSPKSIGSRAGT